MIQDLDDTLKELLVRKAPFDPAEVDIKFEMPTREWSTAVSKPTINIYLYDVRENAELRSSERTRTRIDDGHGTELRPPVRVDLSYLISAWASDIADEHQLLGRILTTMLRFPFLPNDVLKGAMQTQPFPIRGWISLPERTPNSWDVWGHLEHRMKPSLSYVITAAFQPFEPEAVLLATQPVVEIDQILPKKT